MCVPVCPCPPLSLVCDFQSDRLVDLLLPVDSVVGLLAQAVDREDTTSAGGDAPGGVYPQLERLAAAASTDGAPKEVLPTWAQEEATTSLSGNVPQGAGPYFSKYFLCVPRRLYLHIIAILVVTSAYHSNSINSICTL